MFCFKAYPSSSPDFRICVDVLTTKMSFFSVTIFSVRIKRSQLRFHSTKLINKSEKFHHFCYLPTFFKSMVKFKLIKIGVFPALKFKTVNFACRQSSCSAF